MSSTTGAPHAAAAAGVDIHDKKVPKSSKSVSGEEACQEATSHRDNDMTSDAQRNTTTSGNNTILEVVIPGPGSIPTTESADTTTTTPLGSDGLPIDIKQKQVKKPAAPRKHIEVIDVCMCEI